MSQNTPFSPVLARLIVLMQSALSTARRAVRSIIASNNFLSQVPGAPIAAAQVITWTSSPFTTSVARTVRVYGMLFGSVNNPAVTATFKILRDGSPIGATVEEVVSTGPPNLVAGQLEWIDTLPAIGGPHTYAIQCDVGPGNVVAVNPGQALIIVEERAAP